MPNTSTLPPTAELFQQIGYMADDESSIRRVLRYVKRVNNQRTNGVSAREKPVIPARVAQDIVESIKDIKENKGASFVSWEQLKKEMHDEGYFH